MEHNCSRSLNLCPIKKKTYHVTLSLSKKALVCFKLIELMDIFMTPFSMATILLINGPSFTNSTVIQEVCVDLRRNHTSLDSISNLRKVHLVSYIFYIVCCFMCNIHSFEFFSFLNFESSSCRGEGHMIHSSMHGLLQWTQYEKYFIVCLRET